MANDAIKEMISAFAIGCMDKENYKQFRKYLEDGGELPRGELGDLQNIIALIPTILDIETPNEELKNDLGKRLIQIQKDIKNKVVEDRRETRIDVTEEFMQRNDATKIFDVNEKRMEVSHQSFAEKNGKSKTSINKTENVTRLNTITEPVKESRSLSNILQWVFSGVLLIALIVITYLFMGRVSLLGEANSELKNSIVKLRKDLAKTDDFKNQNMEFVEFFNNPYIDIIPLKGAKSSSKGSGRLFIAFGSGEGLLQLQNMPHIDAEMTFQLWLVSKTGTFSLGTFEVKPDKKYMTISEIPFIMKEDIEMFRITKEKKEETLVPTGETILFGALRNESTSKRRRR